MSDNRPSVYYEPVYDNDATATSVPIGERMVIRASAIGGKCLWELGAAGQGIDPGPLPENIARAFREGDMYEPIVLNRLKQMGWVLDTSEAQSEANLVLMEDLIVRSHPDGIGYQQLSPDHHCDRRCAVSHNRLSGALIGGLYIVEVKALADSTFDSAVRHGVGSIFDYDWQASVQMHTRDLPLVWVCLNKDDIKKRGLSESEARLYIEYCEAPPISLSDIRAKALAIREVVEGDDILSAGRPCDDPGHFPCLYINVRPESEDDDGDKLQGLLDVPEADRGRVDQLITEYVRYKGEADESAQRRDAARDALLGLVGDDHAGLATDQWIAPVVRSTQSNVDWSQVPANVKRIVDEAKVSKPKKPYFRDIKRRGF